MLECIGILLLIVALATFTASVITHPSLQCGGECGLAGLYSTFTYMVAGFNVLLSLVLILAGRHLKRRLQSLD
jgi:hypothetical protein